MGDASSLGPRTGEINAVLLHVAAEVVNDRHGPPTWPRGRRSRGRWRLCRGDMRACRSWTRPARRVGPGAGGRIVRGTGCRPRVPGRSGPPTGVSRTGSSRFRGRLITRSAPFPTRGGCCRIAAGSGDTCAFRGTCARWRPSPGGTGRLLRGSAGGHAHPPRSHPGAAA
jgi:hypothetical protein